MKLTFLGTGSAFTVGDGNYQSNMLLENGEGKFFLIDCGSDARRALYDLGYNHQQVDQVYISHLHADHTGGLEWLAFTRKFDGFPKPKLFVSNHLVDDLWDKVLAGGLNTLDGVLAQLSTYFEVHAIEDNGSFLWSNIEFKPFQTIHVMTGYSLTPSYGLIFNVDHQQVLVTTDAQLAPHQIIDFYQNATIIFQDCETSEKATGVHAHYRELVKLPKEIKEKMWLYHYNSGPLPDAKKNGFRGFAKKGQCFNFADPKTLF